MRRHDRLNWLNANGYVIALITDRQKSACPPFWLNGVPYYRPHHFAVLRLLGIITEFGESRFYHPDDKSPVELAKFLHTAPAKWWMGLNRYRKHILVLAEADPPWPHPLLSLLVWLLEYPRCS